MNQEVKDAIAQLEIVAKQFELGGYTRVRYDTNLDWLAILLRKGYAEVNLQVRLTFKKYEDTI